MTKNILSINEIENIFLNYVAEAGVILTNRPLIAEGELHRGHVEGDKNGAYILHLNHPVSDYIQHYSSTVKCNWVLSSLCPPL
jgi:putative DNA primase/helicase